MTGEIADQSAECKFIAPDDFLEGTGWLPYLRPAIESLLVCLGLSRGHRPSSTEWDEVLAKDRMRFWRRTGPASPVCHARALLPSGRSPWSTSLWSARRTPTVNCAASDPFLDSPGVPSPVAGASAVVDRVGRVLAKDSLQSISEGRSEARTMRRNAPHVLRITAERRLRPPRRFQTLRGGLTRTLLPRSRRPAARLIEPTRSWLTPPMVSPLRDSLRRRAPPNPRRCHSLASTRTEAE